MAAIAAIGAGCLMPVNLIARRSAWGPKSRHTGPIHGRSGAGPKAEIATRNTSYGGSVPPTPEQRPVGSLPVICYETL